MTTKLSDKEKTVLRGIGYYFMERNLKDNPYEEAYVETCKTLTTMNITGIKTVEENHYEITLCRPGLLIGAKGIIINEICDTLNIQISIQENTVPNYVFPVDILSRFEELY